MRTPRFFYLIPKEPVYRVEGENRLQFWCRRWRDRGKQPPSGGVKVIYQHCDLLNRNGFPAFPVHVGGRFDIDWYKAATEPLDENTARAAMTADDILVCPEVIPEKAAEFPPRRKIAFLQSWSLIEKATGPRTFEDFGFKKIICCSNFIRDFIASRSKLPCTVIRNGIDLRRFQPPAKPAPENTVLFLARKNLQDAQQAISLLSDNVRSQLAFHEHRGASTEAEMIKLYQQADIFMATGYPEGFGLPPLEAMACGCAVTGFTGGGGDELMIDGETALVAPDGDAEALAHQLERLITHPDVKEEIRKNGHRKAQSYGLENMEQDLCSFAAAITSSPDAE